MFYLKRNVPAAERIARLAGATLMVLAAVLGGLEPAWAWLLGGSGLGLALTALLGFCPACAMMGRRPLDRQP
ncbi:YgaP-like transmembrane domain [Roseateles flavus]|uniref:YgaP-like transmembrane domain n=1 Tax=Roseateles flavus TaxID=3149041 RepID=A0ABV0G7X4_9BURK